MRPWLAFLILLGAPASVLAQTSPQELLLRAKPAVAIVVTEVGADVTVRCGGGKTVTVSTTPFRESGTGFFISPQGWMLTNAHLVSPAHELPKWLMTHHAEKGVRAACLPAALAARGLTPGERPSLEDELTRQILVTAGPSATTVLQPSISVILANGFRLPAKVRKFSPAVVGTAMAGRDLALLHVEASDLPSLSLGDSTQAKIGDRLHIIGFPGVVMSHELLNASAKVEASVTNGAISGFKQDVASQPVIQTDAAAAPGASGSPAVAADGSVLGVLSFVTSDQGTVVQGFNFILPSAAVSEFLKGSGVPLTEPSRFNAAWHAGLAAHFAGNYSRAARHFEEANRLMPELPDVRRMSADNAQLRKSEPLVPWRTVAIVVLIACGLGYGVLLARRRRRNRYRIRPAEVARLVESDQPPVILDVRDTPTYTKSPVRIPQSLHITPEELAKGPASLDVDRERTVVAYCT